LQELIKANNLVNLLFIEIGFNVFHGVSQLGDFVKFKSAGLDAVGRWGQQDKEQQRAEVATQRSMHG
jgi:hypothetical protein